MIFLLESEEGPPRKYYSLTEQGYQVKEDLINEWSEFSVAVNTFLGEVIR